MQKRWSDADHALVDGRVRARVGRALKLLPLPSTVLKSLSVLLSVGVRLLLRGLRVGVEDEYVVAAAELIRQDLAGLHLREAIAELLVSGSPPPAGVDGGHSFIDDHDLDGRAPVLSWMPNPAVCDRLASYKPRESVTTTWRGRKS